VYQGPPGYPQQYPHQHGYAQPGYPRQQGGPEPGYGQHPGFPPWQTFPPPLVPPSPVHRAGPSPKTGGMVLGCLVLVLLVGGLVVVGVGVAAGWFTSDNAASEARVGDCVKAVGAGPKLTDVEKVDCTAPDAAYKVATRGGRYDPCGDVAYGSYGQRQGKRSGYTLCLMLNAKQGDCFQQTVGFPTGQATKVACGAGATYRVTKFVEGVADKTQCGRNAEASAVSSDFSKPRVFVYPRPPTTICTEGAR
jgi:hypothetical protein